MGPSRWTWLVVLVGCRAAELADATPATGRPIPDGGVADGDADTDADSDAETETDTGPDVPFTPVTVELASVVCDGTVAEYFLYTTGLPHSTMVFSQETGAVEVQWADTHDLESYESDPGGTWEHFVLRLRDGSNLADPENDWVRNESTVFTCDADYGHFAMAYAFAAFYAPGRVADCLVFGNRSQELLAGTFERAAEPEFETAACRIGVGVGR